MKDKSSRTKRVAEVLDEIQSYLDSESARMEMPGGAGSVPVDLRFVSASRNSVCPCGAGHAVLPLATSQTGAGTDRVSAQ